MATKKINIGCSSFGTVYAGQLNKDKTMWLGEKQDVTDEATIAVAASLLVNNKSFEFEAEGKKYLLTVKKL